MTWDKLCWGLVARVFERLASGIEKDPLSGYESPCEVYSVFDAHGLLSECLNFPVKASRSENRRNLPWGSSLIRGEPVRNIAGRLGLSAAALHPRRKSAGGGRGADGSDRHYLR